jgi:hypothetical protein
VPTAPTIDLATWLDAALGCLTEVCSASLGSEPLPRAAEPAVAQLCGSLIAIVSDHNAAYVGVSSSLDGCRAIAAAMLGMSPDEGAELSVDDIRDSVGELVNLLVGAIKTRVCDRDAALNLGLPLFLEGAFTSDSHGKVLRRSFDIVGVECVLTVLSPTAEIRSAA